MGMSFIYSFISDNRYRNSSLYILRIKMGEKNADAPTYAYNDITAFPVIPFIHTAVWKERNNNG